MNASMESPQASVPEPSQVASLKPAGLGQRLAAFVIDAVLANVMIMLPVGVLSRTLIATGLWPIGEIDMMGTYEGDGSLCSRRHDRRIFHLGRAILLHPVRVLGVASDPGKALDANLCRRRSTEENQYRALGRKMGFQVGLRVDPSNACQRRHRCFNRTTQGGSRLHGEDPGPGGQAGRQAGPVENWSVHRRPGRVGLTHVNRGALKRAADAARRNHVVRNYKVERSGPLMGSWASEARPEIAE